MEQASSDKPSAGNSAPPAAPTATAAPESKASNNERTEGGDNKKRKWDDHRGGKSLQHGSRGPNKKKNIGRKEHLYASPTCFSIASL